MNNGAWIFKRKSVGGVFRSCQIRILGYQQIKLVLFHTPSKLLYYPANILLATVNASDISTGPFTQ